MKTSVKKLISMAICLIMLFSMFSSCLVYAEENVLSVSQALTATDGTETKVEGLYVGISKEGSKSADNPAKEMLIKDLSSDAIIAVRDVPYGTWPDYGYEKGDKIEFTATVKDDTSTNNPGKKYLVFSADNGEIESTIISKGNEVTYNLNDVVTLSTWTEMKNFFKSSTIKPYTYVKFTESSYFQYYDTTQTYRIHKNGSAGSLADIKPDKAHAISLKNDVHSANLGSDWTKLFFESYNPPAKWPGLDIDKEFYALYVGGDSIHFEMVILDDSWVVNEPTDEPTVEPDEPTDEPYVAEFDNYDIVNEIALAYQRQNLAGQSFYDMYNGRRNVYSSPEDSTSQRTIYLGAHFPSDVICGALLGILTAYYLNKLHDKTENTYKLYIYTAIISTIFAGIFMIKPNSLYLDFYKFYGLFLGFLFAVKFEEKYVNFDYSCSAFKKVLRVIIGVILAYTLKESIKLLLVTESVLISYFYNVLRYFLLVAIVFGLLPWVFKKLKM